MDYIIELYMLVEMTSDVTIKLLKMPSLLRCFFCSRQKWKVLTFSFLVSLWIFLPWGVLNLYFASHKHPSWSCTNVISLCCSLKWLVHSSVLRSHHFRCLACATCPLFPLEVVLLICIPVFLSPSAISGDLDILKKI